MCDVYYILSAMKLSCIKKLSNKSHLQTLFQIYPLLNRLKLFGSIFAKLISQTIHNKFWEDVLKHMIKIYSECEVGNGEDFFVGMHTSQS